MCWLLRPKSWLLVEWLQLSSRSHCLEIVFSNLIRSPHSIISTMDVLSVLTSIHSTTIDCTSAQIRTTHHRCLLYRKSFFLEGSAILLDQSYQQQTFRLRLHFERKWWIKFTYYYVSPIRMVFLIMRNRNISCFFQCIRFSAGFTGTFMLRCWNVRMDIFNQKATFSGKDFSLSVITSARKWSIVLWQTSRAPTIFKVHKRLFTSSVQETLVLTSQSRSFNRQLTIYHTSTVRP